MADRLLAILVFYLFLAYTKASVADNILKDVLSPAFSLNSPIMNISNVFKGEWQSRNVSEQVSLDASINDVNGLGHIIMSFKEVPLVSGVSYVTGHLRFREGRFALNNNVHLFVRGLYIHSSSPPSAIDDRSSRGGWLLLAADSAVTVPLHGLKMFSEDASFFVNFTTLIVEADKLELEQQYKTAKKKGINSKDEKLNSNSEYLNNREYATDTWRSLARIMNDVKVKPEHCQQLILRIAVGNEANHEILHLASTRKDGAGPSDVVLLHGVGAMAGCELKNIYLTAETLDKSSLNLKVVIYSIVVACISIVQAALFSSQFQSLNRPMLSKMSFLSIGMQAGIDFSICIAHLIAGVVLDHLFVLFACVTIFNIFNFAMLEMRFVLTAWRARQPVPFPGQQRSMAYWEHLRKQLYILYMRLYGSIMIGHLLIFWLPSLIKVAIFTIHSFWVPQFVRNVRLNQNRALLPGYVMGMTVTRLILPAIFFMYDENSVVEPDPWFFRLLGWWLLFQVVMLQFQDRFGARFFLPSVYLPPMYDYHRFVDFEHLKREFEDDPLCSNQLDCVICMQAIDLRNSLRYMITPCNHLFHTGCLETWMDRKAECPTCRGVLPVF